MKGKYWLIFLVVIILAVVLVCDYCKAPVEKKVVTPELEIKKPSLAEKIEQPVSKVKNKDEKTDNKEEDDSPTRKLYTYRQTFRDPFSDYRLKEKVGQEGLLLKEEVEIKLTEEKIREIIPFKLCGIIGNSEKRLAVLETEEGSQIIKLNDMIGDFEIVKIEEESIIVYYKDVSIIIEMGDGSGGS